MNLFANEKILVSYYGSANFYLFLILFYKLRLTW